jgi:hypothetical protein
MGITYSGTGRIRVIGVDNQNNEAVNIVAWKKNTYASDGSVSGVETKVRRVTEKGIEEVTLAKPVFDFSCAIEYPYMVDTYSNGTAVAGTATTRNVDIVNIKTGATGEFSGEGLLMRTKNNSGEYEWDKTFEGYERWKMLTACGIINTKV